MILKPHELLFLKYPAYKVLKGIRFENIRYLKSKRQTDSSTYLFKCWSLNTWIRCDNTAWVFQTVEHQITSFVTLQTYWTISYKIASIDFSKSLAWNSFENAFLELDNTSPGIHLSGFIHHFWILRNTFWSTWIKHMDI